jgi:2-keto-3-deoxy-galactonokinase
VQAVHLRGEETLLAGNDGMTEAVYVIAGGHASDVHH